MARASSGSESLAGVTITTPGRVMYPSIGFTKIDLARYYDAVAVWMLPHVQGRPLTLVRCERGVTRSDGLRSQCSFLRHTSEWHRWAPASIDRVRIQEQRKVR